MNLVSFENGSNHILETFTDERLTVVPRIQQMLRKRENRSDDDTDDTDDEDEGIGAFIQRKIFRTDKREARQSRPSQKNLTRP